MFRFQRLSQHARHGRPKRVCVIGRPRRVCVIVWFCVCVRSAVYTTFRLFSARNASGVLCDRSAPLIATRKMQGVDVALAFVSVIVFAFPSRQRASCPCFVSFGGMLPSFPSRHTDHGNSFLHGVVGYQRLCVLTQKLWDTSVQAFAWEDAPDRNQDRGVRPKVMKSNAPQTSHVLSSSFT